MQATDLVRTITIIVRTNNNFDVHEGDAYASRLCWDEMLGCVAKITLGHAPPYFLSADAHIARMERWNRKPDATPKPDMDELYKTLVAVHGAEWVHRLPSGGIVYPAPITRPIFLRRQTGLGSIREALGYLTPRRLILVALVATALATAALRGGL